LNRIDGRKSIDLRPVTVTRNYIPTAEGSVLFELGNTKVICTASVEEKVPGFLRGSGKGWITAEYCMLPRSTQIRTPRESVRGRVGGRTHEIQRMIGRSLRTVVDLEKMGENTVWLDCDIILADGGTRTAAVTGAFFALFDALKYMQQENIIGEMLISDYVAATSVGIVDDTPCLDLCYAEDANAAVDMNVIMTGDGRIIEIQGTAEKIPFSRTELGELLDLAELGIEQLIEIQKSVIGEDLGAGLDADCVSKQE
jgi:ribonuclease PH